MSDTNDPKQSVQRVIQYLKQQIAKGPVSDFPPPVYIVSKSFLLEIYEYAESHSSSQRETK